MSRDEFLDYLTRAVSEDFLTEREAIELLRRFDRGEVNESMLPLSEDEAITPLDDDAVNRALIALAALGIVSQVKDVRFPRWSERQQEATASRLQDRFAETVRGFAYKAIKDLPDWHRSMSLTVQEHIVQQAMMGRMRPLLPSELATLDRVVEAQQRFALRFADEQASRLLMGNPFSVEYVAHRSELYNGEARAEFYRQKEEEEAEDGYVYDYISVDDNGTCQPCLDAEAASPYMAGDGPMPGSECSGGGFCRCTREARYDPDAAAELRRELIAA